MAREDRSQTSAKEGGAADDRLGDGAQRERRAATAEPATASDELRSSIDDVAWTPPHERAVFSDEGASASSGRSGSWRAAKATGNRQMNATLRGAASSGEQRGATTGPRKGVRGAGDASRGTSKRGIRRGSTKSRSARRAGVP